ncbi:secondary thiamine-phosphate synthase enzyme YjbQ [Pseudodesulfovibrio thermohalotolerans]|uniref:secondary thiamine-phosphate synthase enzyme YjbQ n=1 Tax=Pseudodesulfovibrio thermohalotolerans TaxID=2880651 RepID=UPI002441CC11|nr:secondary thiamine-phosphate synthase enzyme YjbQ [Pseudodesulfovibrio thermohalotolerans]WFS62190.1 secondary thiamine-phosphate synthase enzyme YjbQ [Pseudodesulfovibrio thermohalotolerans]
MEILEIRTREREELIDVTGAVRKAVRENGWTDGALLLYCPHTTGAVTVNEGADPDVVRDIVVNMRKLVPHGGDYRHAEGNSDAHIKSSLFGCDQMVIVEGGDLMLGTWQKIYFCEFDGPRTRKLWVRFLAS